MSLLVRLGLVVSLLGAGIASGHAVESENRPTVPVLGLELGARLASQAVPSPTETAENSDKVSIVVEAPAQRAERKVRIVYPLPR